MSRSFKTQVVGVRFKNPDGSDRQKIISKCKAGESLLLQRDYNNQYDPNAIAILRKTREQLGFIARDVAEYDLAPLIDTDSEVMAKLVDIVDGIIEIEIGSTPYKVKEDEARALKDSAKSCEKNDPLKAINIYRKSIEYLIEVDILIRKTYAFKKQVRDLGKDLGTWRRMSFPIERITALLEKNKNYSECLSEIENYEKIEDKKGLSKTDIDNIAERKSRILHIITIFKET